MSVIDTIKTHPVPVIGGGVVLAILISMRSNSAQGAGASNMSAAIASQQIAGQTDTALSAINADVQKTGLTVNGQTAMQREAIMGGLWNTQIQANTMLAAQDKQSQMAEFLGALGYSQNMQALADQTQTAHEQTQAGAQVAGQALNTQIQLAQINGQNQIAVMDSPNYSTLLQHYENMQTIAGQTAVNLANVNIQPALANAQANQTLANSQANTASNNSSMAWLGTAATIAAMFL